MNINNEKSADLVLIQITDLHIFTNGEDDFSGINSYNSLQAVLNLIKDDFSEYDLMLATGDLVQDTEETAYKNLLEILDQIDQPIYSLPGNHDDPELMRKMFKKNNNIHFDQKVQIDNWSILFLNSYKANTHSGYLNKKELVALQEGLEKSKDSNVLICLHHHPVSINSEWMDGMMLENPDDLFEIVDQYDHVKGIIWGHIHQEFSQIRNDVLLLGTPSTCAQFLPKAKEYGTDDKQPGYRWLKLISNGDIETGIKRISPQHYHEDKPD